MIFARRGGEASPHLEWRIRLFGVGAILAMVGIWAEQRWLVNGALVVLVLGFALRFPKPARDGTGEDDEGPPR